MALHKTAFENFSASSLAEDPLALTPSRPCGRPSQSINRGVYISDQSLQSGQQQNGQRKEEPKLNGYGGSRTVPAEADCGESMICGYREIFEVFEFFSGIGGLHAGWSRAVDIFNNATVPNSRGKARQATPVPTQSGYEGQSAHSSSENPALRAGLGADGPALTGNATKSDIMRRSTNPHVGQNSTDDLASARNTCSPGIFCPGGRLDKGRGAWEDGATSGCLDGAAFSGDCICVLEAPVCRAYDVNSTANAVYAHNFRLVPQAASLEYLSASSLRKSKSSPDRRSRQRESADVWLLSPPCQPYTRGGKRLDMKDPRAAGLLHLLRLLLELEDTPRMLFLENVRGFESSESHHVLTETLRLRGYRVEEFLVSPTQLGCPNTRVRYYCLAWQGGARDRVTESEGDRREQAEVRTEGKRGAGGDVSTAAGTIRTSHENGKGEHLRQELEEATRWKQEEGQEPRPGTATRLRCFLPPEALRLWWKYSFPEAGPVDGSTQADRLWEPPGRQIGYYLDAEMGEEEFRSLVIPPAKLSRFVRFAAGSCTHACTSDKPPRGIASSSKTRRPGFAPCSRPGEVGPIEDNTSKAKETATEAAPRETAVRHLQVTHVASDSPSEESDSAALTTQSPRTWGNQRVNSSARKAENGDSAGRAEVVFCTIETPTKLCEVKRLPLECSHDAASSRGADACQCYCCVAQRCMCDEVAFRLDIVTAASTASTTFTKGYGSNLHRGGPLLLVGPISVEGATASSASSLAESSGSLALQPQQAGSSGRPASWRTKPPCYASPSSFPGFPSNGEVDEQLSFLLPLSSSSAHVFATEAMDSSRFRHALKASDVLRLFSPRELLRLHGYPPSFSFPENVSVQKALSLVGNSVNVDVVSVLLLHMLLSYFGDISGRTRGALNLGETDRRSDTETGYPS